MGLKPFTTKLDTKTLEALRKVSEKTRIPQSQLVREGIALVLRRHAEDSLTLALRSEIEDLLKEDRGLLRRLADA